MAVTVVTSKVQCDALVAANAGLVAINFWASWAPSCEQMNLVTTELAKKYTHAAFLSVSGQTARPCVCVFVCVCVCVLGGPAVA